jgi:hypothetical protein
MLRNMPFISPLFKYIFSQSADIYTLRNELTGNYLELPPELNTHFLSFLDKPYNLSYYK